MGGLFRVRPLRYRAGYSLVFSQSGAFDLDGRSLNGHTVPNPPPRKGLDGFVHRDRPFLPLLRRFTNSSGARPPMSFRCFMGSFPKRGKLYDFFSPVPPCLPGGILWNDFLVSGSQHFFSPHDLWLSSAKAAGLLFPIVLAAGFWAEGALKLPFLLNPPTLFIGEFCEWRGFESPRTFEIFGYAS